MPQPKATILSGIRATGQLHFGNFMGAVRHFVAYQQPENLCLYFIADLHSLTTLEKPEELRGNVLRIVKDYLAAGLDPNRSVIYAQSSVPEIPALAQLISNVVSLGEIERTTTFKDLIRKNSDNVNLGLANYPVLMAADILGCKATLVPVGEDQRPNVEVARNIVGYFNGKFGDTFVMPEMMVEMSKIPGLDGAKMGKSEANNAIDINSPIAAIRKRYMERGITDPQRLRASDPGDPYHGCRSVYPLHEIITSGESDSREIANLCRSAQIGCVACKNRLVDSIAAILEPFQERRRELADKDDYAREVLHEGGKRARAIFAETLAVARDRMGIIVY